MSISKVQCLSLHRKCSSTDLSVDEKLTEKKIKHNLYEQQEKKLGEPQWAIGDCPGTGFWGCAGVVFFVFNLEKGR